VSFSGNLALKRLSTRLSISLLLAMLCSCATVNRARCPSGELNAVGDTLYFGTAMPDGIVTPEQFESFVATEVTPRFPRGLTSWRATGQWLSESGKIEHEQSYVLYLVHPDTRANEEAIREIISTYRTVFHQEAVLRVRSVVCISV